jgi:hypothetical protein
MPLSPLLSYKWQASLQLLTPNKGNSKMNTKTPAKIEMSVFIHHQLCHCNQHINDLQQRVVPSSQQYARQLIASSRNGRAGNSMEYLNSDECRIPVLHCERTGGALLEGSATAS